MRIDTNTPQSFSSPNGAIKVTYTNNISQTENSKAINEAIKLDLSSNEPIIKARNGYVNIEQEKRMKMLDEYYAKMDEDLMQILDKIEPLEIYV